MLDQQSGIGTMRRRVGLDPVVGVAFAAALAFGALGFFALLYLLATRQAG